ncbi:MAG TPA: hypothetical protein VK908_06255 [Jiangellales bacterium]|nr:hypothetical protein [Jiangellales bacterium]
MASVLEGLDVTRVAVALSLLLVGGGLSIAWLPVVRVEGWTSMFPRVLVFAGLAAAVLDGIGLGTVLGLALAALGVVAGWQARPAPDLPRPGRAGIVAAAVVTGLLVVAVDRGWWLLGSVPEVARVWVALGLAAVGALATLAIADRERVRLREALLRHSPPA